MTKKALILAVALAPALSQAPIFSQEPAKRPAAAEKTKTHISSTTVKQSVQPATHTSTGTAGAGLQPRKQAGTPSQTQRIAEELKNWDTKLSSLQADFTQEIDFTDAGLKQNVEGKLHYVKPSLLRIEHIRPARQIIFTDKNELWIYKPEDAQAVKTDWGAWKQAQNDGFSGILDFGNYASMLEKNNIEKLPEGDTNYITVDLTSGKTPDTYKLTLKLSPGDYFPAEAVFTEGKIVIKTRLENAVKNRTVPGDIFKFVPPKGTEIIEFGQ